MDELYERPLKIVKSSKIAAGVVDLIGTEDENYVNGGVLTNSKVSWISCGSRLTTLNCDTGSKRTGWTFGWALQDPTYKIVCVEELPNKSGGSPILIVACESESTGSSLCFYHSGSSRVLKAVHFTEKITSLSIVSKLNESEKNICNLLKPWNGIVAVGTSTGKVYLVDVWWIGLEKCMDDYQHKHYDEQRQSKISEVSIQDLKNDINVKTSNVRHGSVTLALWLNEETLLRERRLQCVLGRLPREFLGVSSLKYFPQISMLAVGYNTSCFQLWNLKTLAVQYTSPLLEAMLPVFSFTLLEPSDDPRFVCYLWSFHHSVDEDNIPFAGMYLLSFRDKHLNNYHNEHYYEGLSSCNICYQLDLGNEIEDAVSGRIVSCQAIRRANTKSSPLWLDTGAEEGSQEDITTSLLAIAWEVWTLNQAARFQRLTLFDLNQWYREYMPHSSDISYSRFMTHFCLPDGLLLAAKVLPHTVKQFVTLQPVDEHFYPSGTSFQCVCLEQSRVLTCAHLGLQEECLEAIQEGGPSALLLPAQLYKLCLQAGIKPLLGEVASPTSSRTKEQREWVLSVALEYGMIQYLCNCVRDWADGSHAVADCTLPSLLQWAWGRVQLYKKWLDRLCVPLFDYSGTALDSNNLVIFHHVISLLHSLQNIFRLVLEKYRNCILQDSFEQQHLAINLVTTYYDTVLWCVKNKVLPETNAGDTNINGHIPYFTEKIVSSTITRRVELHQLAKSLRHPAPTSGLLLIDAVIAQEAGGTKLTDQWEREGGGATVGKYPPPSVQSVLRTYLVRGIPLHIKHFIVSYFLHDIIHVLSNHSLNEETIKKLSNYGSDFNLTESQCKIIQAFWCLDNKNFEEGVGFLLDSCVHKEDIQVYQHRTIICLLAASGQHKLALHYLNVRRPGLCDPQDIKMKMTLLLVNNLIHEAFELQRQHHKVLSAELLQQFFTGCVEMNKLDIVFKLPLSLAEEEAFMAFLEKTTHPQADDLRVLYLLSRSRYIEAIDMNEKLRSISGTRRGTSSLPLGHSPLGSRSRNLFGPRDEMTGAPAKAVLTTRDLIINSVAKSLPSVTRELADLCSKEKKFNWKQVERPTPLSVVVHTAFTNERLPFYKMNNSLLVETALSKTRETWAPLLATPAALKRKLSSTVEDTPFLRTPLIPRLNTSLSNYSSPSESRSVLHSRTEDFSFSTKRPKLECSLIKEKETLKGDWSFNKSLDSNITCPESSALLHTPLVARTVKQKPKETSTPHSILKGRSAANTPTTPARGDKSIGSPAITRQIRFSLPNDSPVSNSSQSVKEEEESDYSPSISPRKSIHHLSSIQTRKSTPANPRISRKPLRSVVTSLKFDDEDIVTEKIHTEQSATAAALLKKISSSSISSDETYFSLRSSSSSKCSEGKKSELRFQLPLGLEENMDYSEEGSSQNEELNVTKGQELEDVTDLKSFSKTSSPDSNCTISEETLVQTNMVETSKIIEGSISETPDVKSPKKEVKIVVECSSGTRSVKKIVEGYDTTEEIFKEANSSFEMDVEENEICSESNESTNKSPMFKWTKELNGESGETLKLQVNKYDEKGLEKCVAIVSLSEEMPMFYLESKEDLESKQTVLATKETAEKEGMIIKPQFESKKEEKALTESIFFEKENSSLSKSEGISKLYKLKETSTDGTNINISNLDEVKSNDTNITESNTLEKTDSPQDTLTLNKGVNQDISIDGTPLPQVLEEILKRGRISSSPKDRLKTSTSGTIDNEDDYKRVTKHTDNDDDPSFVEVEKIENHDICDIVSVSNELKGKTFTLHEKEVNDILRNDVLQEKTADHEKQSESKILLAGSESADLINEPIVLQEEKCDLVSLNHQISCIATEVVNVETSSEDKITVVGIIETTESKEVIFNENTTENKEMKEMTFVLEPENIRSSSPCISNELAEDSTAQIELQMSEGDSIENYKKNDEEVVEEEPVYETLATVDFQTGLDDIYMEDNFEGEYDQGDEDIYGDIQEDKELSSGSKYDEEEGCNEEYDSNNESEEEERSSDVICLDSSSDEEPLNANHEKLSSHKQKIAKFSKSPKIANETLDYEDDYGESDEEKREEEEEERSECNYSESSKDDIEGSSSDKEEYNQHSFDDFNESEEEENRRGNRSWKTEGRVSDSNESLHKNSDISEEDTIESPPFEVIGQDSQSEESTAVVKRSYRNLETIVEETANNIHVEAQTPNSLPSCDNGTSLDDAKIAEIQNEFSKTEEVDKQIYQKNDNNADTIELSKNRRKQFFETGSILDLKKRRSKRYSSASDLSLTKKNKSRRRSCSFHDFASMIISETKSAKFLSREETIEPVVSEEQTIENTGKNEDSKYLEFGHKPDTLSRTITSSNKALLQSQDDVPPEEISSKASSLYVELGSVSSSQFQEDPGLLGLTTAKALEFPKIRSKSITSRFCSSLHNISEEVPCNSSTTIGNNPQDSKLRRSLSSNDIVEHGHFEGLPRRSSSVSKWSEYVKAHESEMVLELNDNQNSSDNMDISADISTANKLKQRSRSTSNLSTAYGDARINLDDNESKRTYNQTEQVENSFTENKPNEEDRNNGSEVLSSRNVEISDSSELEVFKTNQSDRNRRGQSEPLSSPSRDIPRLTTKRRSSSLLKIQNIHRKVFPRHSLRSYSHKISYEPLEIVNSDEDSLTESGNIETNQVSEEANELIISENEYGSPQQKINASSQGINCQVTEQTSESIKEESEERTPQEAIAKSEGTSSVDDLQINQHLSNTNNTLRAQSEPPSFENIPRKMSRKSSSTLKIERLHNLVLPRHSLRRSTLRKSSFQPLEIIQSDEEKSFDKSNHASPEQNVSNSENEKNEDIDKGDDDLEKALISHMIPKSRGKRQKSNVLSKDKPAMDTGLIDSAKINDTELIDSERPSEVTNNENIEDRNDGPGKVIVSQVTTKKRGRKRKNVPSSPENTNLDNIILDSQNNKDVGNKTLPSESPHEDESVNKDALKSTRKVQKKGRKQNNLSKTLPDNSENKSLQNNASVSNFQGNVQAMELDKHKEDEVLISALECPQPPKKRGRKLKVDKQLLKQTESLDGHLTQPVVNTVLNDKLLQNSPQGSTQTPDATIPEMEPKSKKNSKYKTQKTRASEKSSQDDKKIDKVYMKKSEKKEVDEDILSIPKKQKFNQDTNEETDMNKTKKSKKQINEEKPSFSISPDSSHLDTSVTSSNIIETPKKGNNNFNLEQSFNLLDSPARRTRRSMSRLSDTELLTPVLEANARRRTRRSGAMSDIVTPSKHIYAESEASDISTSSKLHTPTRRSSRRQSFSATPGTPELVPEEYIVQRRLTRNQHAQLQKSFEFSLKESPRISRLEDLPEESAEAEESSSDQSIPTTPLRSSSRTLNKTTPKYSKKQSRNKTAK